MNQYIYGAGGHGKVVLDAMTLSSIRCKGFLDDKSILQWCGLPVSQFSEVMLESKLHIAIGNCKIRQAIVEKLGDLNYFNVIHNMAVVSSSAKVGIGSFIAAGVIVAPDAKVGDHCLINHSAVVDHDCVVGNFSHIAPQVSLGGGVKIGRGVLIGSGAVVLPGVTVADYSIVGAGSVVIKDVKENSVVVGAPARDIR